MTTPETFNIGAQAGTNISRGIRRGLELSKMDQIMQAAAASNDPNQLQNIMTQVLPQISAENRPVVEQALKQRHQQLVTAQTQQEMVKIADQIETQFPGSGPHKMIADVYRSNIPVDQKEKLIKGISTTTPFKFEQQARLKQDSIIRNYNSLIKEVDTELNNIIGSGDPDRIDFLNKRKVRLQKERDSVLGFEALREPEEEINEQTGKPIFDRNVPKHKKRFNELDKKFKGNQKKINAAMAKEFSIRKSL